MKEIRAPSRQFKMGLSGPSVVLVLAFFSCFLPYLTGKSYYFIKETCQQVVLMSKRFDEFFIQPKFEKCGSSDYYFWHVLPVSLA